MRNKYPDTLGAVTTIYCARTPAYYGYGISEDRADSLCLPDTCQTVSEKGSSGFHVGAPVLVWVWQERERTLPKERGSTESLLERKAETDRAGEGISEGFHPAATGRVALKGRGVTASAIPRNASGISFTHIRSGRAKHSILRPLAEEWPKQLVGDERPLSCTAGWIVASSINETSALGYWDWIAELLSRLDPECDSLLNAY